jgi:hypothetical protein
MRRQPLWPAGSAARNDHKTLKIIDGQTVYSSGGVTYYGISKSLSEIPDVPSIYDPNGVGSTAGLFTAITGIGRAFLYVNGELQSDLVLVVLDSRSPVPTLLIDGDFLETRDVAAIPFNSDPTQHVSAYIPLFP